MTTRPHASRLRPDGRSGMTLVETIVSMLIVAVMISATINGYILSSYRAEWSAYSLAAHSMALQRIEQVRAAKWDTAASPVVDLIIQDNFPKITNVLDIPISGSNLVTATVTTIISTVSSNPPLKMVRVDCVWPFMSRGFFSNTVISYRAPDQ